MMDIVFGLWADAGAWPEHGGVDRVGALGAPVVGPSGLLEILETALGLGSPGTPNVVRIAAFQAALEAMDNAPRFWSRSLAVDGWATARTLLHWRDELVDCGWDAKQEWHSPRLAELAVAAAAAVDLPPGISDRAEAIATDLAARPALPIRRIRLIDARDVHSTGWRRLLDRIEACGVAIEQIPTVPAAPEDTALGHLQRWIAGSGPLTGGADGTVTIATSASAVLAAEITSHWFAEYGDREAVLIAQDADTHLLDHGMCGAGQPRAGRSCTSPHRGSLQVLLLAFKVAWAPFDPRALMDLLVFPTSPIAPRACRRLASVLEKAPGRGSTMWNEAWAEIGAAELAGVGDDAGESRKAHDRLERWRAWADPELADPVAGMSLEAALATCDRTISWAVVRYARDEDALYRATMKLAADVRRALIALGRDRLPRTLVERVIDQALDTGHDNPMAEAEAARWRCIPHPGGIWAPTDTIVWWNFRTTQEALQRQPWTNGERRELAERGCPLDAPGISARAASAAWERSIMNARSRILLINGGLDAGEDEALHPLAHRIAPAAERLATRTRMEDALAHPSIVLAGVELRREPAPFAPLPERRTIWPTPAGYADRLEGLAHSASSFESGLKCQLMWALKHVAKLRPGRVRSIPDANQLLGNLAHALAHEIFVPGAPPRPESAALHASEFLEGLIDSIAAPLRLPELAAQLSDARERIPAAMAELARTLSVNDLVVDASESQVSVMFENALAVRGAIDLVAKDRNQNHVIIDLKWTRSAKRRFDELEAGNAVQLATYGAMVADDAPYRAGYFLLNQRQFATLKDGGLIGRQVEARRGFPETWAAIRESWRSLNDSAKTGGLIACGVEGFDEHLPRDLPIMLEANCQWCDYQTLCRVRGLR